MSAEDSNSQSDTSQELKASTNDRPQLIQKARVFLQSPDIRDENAENKRKFLQEKGLTDNEIDSLIRETERQPPPIPPRTYPPPPPSNLPFLLASLFRIISWSLGVSGSLVFIYYRFLLPKISRTLDARHALGLHQKGLLERLRTRLEEVKKVQDESFGTVVSMKPESLPPNIKSLKDISADEKGLPAQPLSIVIRSVYLEPADQKYSVDDLYSQLVEQFPGFAQREADEFKGAITRQLTRSSRYQSYKEGDIELWSYTDVESSPADPSVSALHALHKAISQGQRDKGVYAHTYKSLTDLTAFLSKETYASYNPGFRFLSLSQLSPAQEEVRREIRALKGLALNRRSFAPVTSRVASSPAVPLTSSAVA